MATKKVKKDFDKERMYSKIMPSVFADPATAPPKTAVAAEPDVDPEQQLTQAKGEPQPPEPVEEAVQPAFILRNYMEDIVLEKFPHTMKMLKACDCEACKKDVMAYALNALPPSYMAVEPELVESAVHSLRASMEVKVSSALIQAVQYVKTNPRHPQG